MSVYSVGVVQALSQLWCPGLERFHCSRHNTHIYCLPLTCIYLTYTYSHIDLTDSTTGRAFIGTMCSCTTSVGLTQDTGYSESSVGATATHELGHIMNMRHDDDCELGCMYIYTYCA